jgi:uncharacterized protein
MPERSSYTPGTPCWVDYSSPDLDSSIAFYGGLLGWEVAETETSEQTGGYRRAEKDGHPVAGMMPKMEEGQPTAWTTYVSVADAEATAAAVEEAGGTVVSAPMEVLDLGKLAVFADPGGCFFGIWEPGSFVGAELVNEPGGIAWNELNTRDLAGAKDFYGAVFGWDFDESTPGEGQYAMIVLDGRAVGGLFDLESHGEVPEQVPPHWQVYFGVEDTDAAIAATEGAGGSKMVGPMDIPFGRLAVLADPQGASFAVIALSDLAQQNA